MTLIRAAGVLLLAAALAGAALVTVTETHRVVYPGFSDPRSRAAEEVER